MDKQESKKRGINWVGLPLVATMARLLAKDLMLQNEYLKVENKILNGIPCQYYSARYVSKTNCDNNVSEIGCKEFLDGLLKSYYRKAA